MTFDSLEYLVFLPLVLLIYWQLEHKFQNLFLIGASYFFYGYVHPWFLILLFASTVLDFTCGIAIERFYTKRRIFLILCLVGNLGLLGFYKYFNFFVDSWTKVLETFGLPGLQTHLNIFLPVGISFYTFQSISYTIDVYRKKLKPTRNFIDYAAFVSLFPQLVAGPIERATHLLPQVQTKRTITLDKIEEGVHLCIWGLFQKLFVADNVGIICNKIFSLEHPTFWVLWIGVFGFSFQIYSDFSGYTDIARGSAKLLGFDLMSNFENPYFSKSPIDFWRRWHISLSTWFRDYLYIPLGGSKRSPVRNHFNIIVTFLVSGLWHGASWNFVLWGLYHGCLVSGERWLQALVPERPRHAIWSLLSRGATFLLVTFGWMLFRERDVSRIVEYLCLSPLETGAISGSQALYLFNSILFYAMPMILWSGFQALRERRGDIQISHELRAVLSFSLIMGIFQFQPHIPTNFIYFQF